MPRLRVFVCLLSVFGFTACNPFTLRSSLLQKAPIAGDGLSVDSFSPSQGPDTGYTTLNLFGSGFSEAVTVSLAGIPCSPILLINAHALSCLTPPHSPGEVSVVVSNSRGGVITASGVYRYQSGSSENPGPQILSISPTSGATDGGTPLIINGNHFSGPIHVVLDSSDCLSPDLVSDTQIKCTTPAHALGPVSLSVTNGDGQMDTYQNAFTFVTGTPIMSTPSITGVTPGLVLQDAGTALVISGKAFQVGAAVTLGNLGCSEINVISDSEIHCKTPVEVPGKVGVKVVNPDGGQVTLDQALTISPLQVTSVSPVSGPAKGGTSITVNGAGFDASDFVALGGTNCAQVQFISTSQLICTTGAHASGLVELKLTKASGLSRILSGAFTYNQVSQPTITSFSPTSGPTTGGTLLSITGSGFQNGATVTMSGACGNIQVLSDTALNCTTPAVANAAVVALILKNPDGGSVTSNGLFHYQVGLFVNSVSPSVISDGGGTTLTIRGGGFVAGDLVTVGGGACIPVQLVSVGTAGEIALNCKSSAHAAGTVDLVVTPPTGNPVTLTGAITISHVPTPLTVSPSGGLSTGGTTLTVGAINAQTGVSIKVGNSPCLPVTVLSNGDLSCVTSAGNAGVADISLTNPDGLSGILPSAFTYSDPISISGVSPSAGPTSGGSPIKIFGSGFTQDTKVLLGGIPCQIQSIVENAISCTTSASASAGDVDVMLSNAGTSALKVGGFKYYFPYQLIGVNPQSGPVAGGNPISIAGHHFLPDSTVKLGTLACPVSVVTADSITCTVPTASSPGAVNVQVASPSLPTTAAASLSQAYTYIPVPSITGVVPTHGPPSGETKITVSGTGLISATQILVDGTPCTGVVFASSTSVSCLTPVHSAGTVSVKAVNTGGLNSNTNIQFTYDQAMAVTKVDPIYGPITGGQPVTLTGISFGSGALVKFGSATCQNLSQQGTTGIICTPGPNVEGTVDITVTTADGQTAILPKAYTFKSFYATAITPVKGVDAGGIEITVTGFGFTSASRISLCATAPYAVTSTSLICQTKPLPAQIYDVVVTDGAKTSTISQGYTSANALYTGFDCSTGSGCLSGVSIRPDTGAMIPLVANNLPPGISEYTVDHSGHYLFYSLYDANAGNTVVGRLSLALDSGLPFVANDSDQLRLLGKARAPGEFQGLALSASDGTLAVVNPIDAYFSLASINNLLGQVIGFSGNPFPPSISGGRPLRKPMDPFYDSTGNHIYFVDGNGDAVSSNFVTIQGYHLEGTAVTQLPVSVGLSAASHPLLSVSGKSVYLTHRNGPVSAYAFDPSGTGTLAPLLGDTTISGDSLDARLFAHPGGKFLYLLSSHSGSGTTFCRRVEVLTLDGSTGNIVGRKLATQDSLQCSSDSGLEDRLFISTDGLHLYLTDGDGTSGLLAYGIDQRTGSLVSLGSRYSVASASGLSATPDGKFLYVRGENGAKTVLVGFAINSDGSLSPLSGAPVEIGAKSVGFKMTMN